MTPFQGPPADARPGCLPEAAAAALHRLLRRGQGLPQHRQRRQEVRQERRVPALRPARRQGGLPHHLPRRHREGVAVKGKEGTIHVLRPCRTEGGGGVCRA